MDLGLADATAAVVGGGRGMGLAAARCLADDGARVAVIARSRPDRDGATEDLARRGSPDAVGLVADIRDADQVNDVLDKLGQRWGGELNVLINAVGPTVRGDFEALTDEQWRQAVDEGVMGMVHCVR
jgi:3-oxoacyl-[acyl-carrier protein] reductase